MTKPEKLFPAEGADSADVSPHALGNRSTSGSNRVVAGGRRGVSQWTDGQMVRFRDGGQTGFCSPVRLASLLLSITTIRFGSRLTVLSVGSARDAILTGN